MGTGKLEQSLKTLAHDLGIKDSVRFLGQVHNAKNYFKALDLFVLSSDHEPFGMVLLEAMAAGIPVIATDCGGAKEVVEDSQRRFPQGQAGALAHLLYTAPSWNKAGNNFHHDSLMKFSDATAREKFWSLPALHRTSITLKAR